MRLTFLVLAAGGLFLGAPVTLLGQQNLTPIERSRGLAMLDGLLAELEHHYYDSTYGGRNIDSMWYRASQAIDTATAWPTVLAALAQFLQGLDDSHTRFRPPGLNVAVNYGWSWRMVGEDCLVTGVRDGSDAARAGLQVGDRVLSLDGLRPDRAGMRLIWYVYHILSPRQGMRLYVEHPDGNRASVSFEADVRRVQGTFDVNNLEHLRVLWDQNALAGNVHHDWHTQDSVALWRFDRFRYGDRRIDGHMRQAQRYPWLILDLRGNGGGSVATLTRLIGYFFDESFVAYQLHWRDSIVDHEIEPSTPTYEGQVIVLVDSESGSASEILARVLQQRGRAVIVGDRSAGAVMTSIGIQLDETASGDMILYGLQVTVFDVVMPDGARLEGTGVIPNVPALPTQADIVEGRDPALQFALELAGVRVSAAGAARIWR